MNLVGWHGKLYAGVGYWMDRPNFFEGNPDPPALGPQILVLRSKESQWQQEVVFQQRLANGKPRSNRISAMGSITFHYDEHGGKLRTPVDMLIVGLDGIHGAVFTQKSPGVWEDTSFPTDMAVRSFAVHFDRQTGAEKLYVGSGKGEESTQQGAVYSGVYDPSVPGRIRWNPVPEFTDFKNRVMAIVDCNGTLYFSAKPSIFVKDDQKNKWEALYSYPLTNPYNASKYASGFRGLTCIADSVDPQRKLILGAFEGVPGDIMTIDPLTGHASVELHIADFLANIWGVPPQGGHVLAAYNGMPLVHTASGDFRIIGLCLSNRAWQFLNADRVNSAWFLSRAEGTRGVDAYQLHEIQALPWIHSRSDSKLWSLRTSVVSPFPEDHGRVLYMGGYDGHFAPDHNTAWVYRVGIRTALKPYVP